MNLENKFKRVRFSCAGAAIAGGAAIGAAAGLYSNQKRNRK